MKHRNGSLTIEAALILPVYMTGLLMLVSLLLMLLTGMRIQASLLELSEELQVRLTDGNSLSLSEIENELGEKLSPEDIRFIENGKEGLDMSGSDIDDGEYIRLSVSCELVPLTDFFGMIRVPFSRSTFAHVWCGYENAYFPDGEYVYITNDSEVYHRDRECSHIGLTVRQTSAGEVPYLRNNSGSRYKPCSHCHSSLSDGRLYVAAEGDRYHKTLTCSGLKRTVRAIRISEVGDRRPCSRCGR